MTYLLDTCVISELFKENPNQHVVDWISGCAPDALALSAMTIAELWYGMGLLPAGKRRRAIGEWIERIERDFADRILPFTGETGRTWGDLMSRTRTQGINLPLQDSYIAATALHHDLVLVTRNVRDFRATGVRIINPWDNGG